MEFHRTDVLVIGQGVAGLIAAWRATAAGASVSILSLGGGASGWLQGVNVALGHEDPRDNPSAHEADIMREGYGLSEPELVSQTVQGALEAFGPLDRLGVDFARKGGRYRQRHASGSTFPRCCFVPGMMWGGKAARVLGQALDRAGVARLRMRAVRLLKYDGRVAGVIAVSPRGKGAVTLVGARSVVLASGGIGGLFPRSTYPRDVFGSSYALAMHAGATLKDMEFLQFEPLVGLNPEGIRGYVVPTTLFGDGAVMHDRAGDRFLLDTRPQGERGIGKEELVQQMAQMRREGRTLKTGGLWLDATSVEPGTLNSYPWLQKFMVQHGIDLGETPIEVWPAAHTCLGGLVIDQNREVAGVPGLYAVGEAAGGIHGAGRLAGGSGTDVIASGYIGGKAAAEAAARQSNVDEQHLVSATGLLVDVRAPVAFSGDGNLREVARQVAVSLGTTAGIIRSGQRLKVACDAVAETLEQFRPKELLHPSATRLQVFDQVVVSHAVLTAALQRQESRGAHIREDYPDLNPACCRSNALELSADGTSLLLHRFERSNTC